MNRFPFVLLLLSLCFLTVPALGCGGSGVTPPQSQTFAFLPNFMAAETLVQQLPPGAEYADGPRMCCDGLNVYVVWLDERHGTGGDDSVYFNYSRDGGRTWAPQDQRLDRGTNADAGQPEICCSGNRVYVVWQDDRNDPGGGGDDDIFCNYSTDAGVTWQAQDIPVDEGTGDSDWLTLCCDGLNVYVAWEDDRRGAGNHDIFANASTDGGATWQATDARLSRKAPGAGRSREPQICCAGPLVYVVWYDNRVGPVDDVYLNYSVDAGLTWLSQDVRLDSGAPGAVDSEHARICCDPPYVYVAWEETDPSTSNEEIYFDYSTDGGATWQAVEQRLDTDPAGAADSQDVRICCEGANVAAIWRDNRNGRFNLYFNRSTDAGATWLAEDMRLDGSVAGSRTVGELQICCAWPALYVLFTDNREGNQDPWFTYSLDGGLTWAMDFRIDSGGPGTDSAEDLALCCDGEHVYAAWIEGRNGADGVFFNGSIP